MGRRIFSASGTPSANIFIHNSCIKPCIARTPPRRGYHVTSSCNFGVPAMPVGVLLEDASSLDDGDIVAGARHELQAHGKILVGETAGNGKCRKPAQIPDATLRNGVRESRLQIQVQRGSRDRLSGSHQYIKRVEHGVHLFLQEVTTPLRLHVVRAGKLFIDVPGELTQRVGQFADAPGKYFFTTFSAASAALATPDSGFFQAFVSQPTFSARDFNSIEGE